ncbi:aryl-phospho-beta-D-glucosidase BglC (GH1 family) [Actinoplanes campanulatus]|uniref:Aryl-phospho-beta-D-glucosidase BglC (GH1 family) n=1 Tax=Actinoplanes campanulatus TaxID=113559 RepID=A0A7W5AN12_9ACTN|nr:cellulase family glycosylhydrolase [Actinoplanes campanulatus]MBB3098759.1 aryl-phospho-beta-D-glucosidase BglC (GH1 family) [Actinoplanes campanulatus]GGN37161.1 endoglucanase [Actinoplanes campanulatus]GID40738.1 endoglucanase [Actinoplanes campanulatus]
MSRLLGRLLAFALILGGMAWAGPAQAAPTAAAITKAMQPGWNLGNTLDATGADETSWGNPRVTRELLRGIRAQGFKSIRIPVTWGQHQGPAPDYTIDPAYLARVQEVVGWALDEGFYVMINSHHDSWQWIATMPTDHDNVLARYNAIWTQVAGAFRDTSPRLLLESVNEPQFWGSTGDTENYALLAELNTSFHRIVRGTGGGNAKRLLVLPTLHTNADQGRLDALAGEFTALNDPNLIATVHYYGYWPFSVNVAGGYRFDATAQQDLLGTFQRLRDSLISKGIPVILGEYGLLGFDRHTGTIEQGEKLKFFELFGQQARASGVTTMLWDNGQHYDRTAGVWRDAELFGQISSSWRTRSGTAASDLVFVRRSAPVTAQTITLNLNGLGFTHVRLGETTLRRGPDYQVSGDQLTLTAGLLQRLTRTEGYGVKASLSLRFSRGVPWRLDVVSSDTPQLAAVTGETSAFAIPTTFNGDRLATMTATYADGSNAGPHGWTPYKEFDRAFAPDYPAGTIRLTPDFFAEVTDGAPVNLRFYLWSGETVTYQVTRTGTAVSGTLAG